MEDVGHFVYLTDIWYTYIVAIWYILWAFWYFFSFWYVYPNKSGNPALEPKGLQSRETFFPKRFNFFSAADE
jgi:hypothetical protein